MRQDVRGPRLSDAPQDTSGMRFQFPDTDNALRRSGLGRVVVPHVTTLRAAPLNRQGRSDRSRNRYARRERSFREPDM